MAYDYASIKETADALIEKFGTEVQIERKAEGGDWNKKYNPETMHTYWEDSEGTIVYTAPEDSISVWTGTAIITNWSYEMIANGEVKTSDVRMVISSSVELKVGDEVTTASGRTFYIVPPISVKKPDDDIILAQVVNCRE